MRRLNPRPVILGLVHIGSDLEELQKIVGGGREQPPGLVRAALILAIQPKVEISGFEHRRHALMDRHCRAIGGGGQNAGGVDLAAIGGAPSLIEPGEGERRAIGAAKQKGAPARERRGSRRHS